MPSVFQRGPRQYVAPPIDERVVLPPVPTPVAKPSSSLALVILSAVAGLAMLVGSLVIGGQAVYMLILVVPTLGYAGYGLAMYVKERRRYPVDVRERRSKFIEALMEPARQLEQLREQQRSASLRVHPTWQECLARVQRRDPRLWERTLADADFLELRVGTGVQHAVYAFDLPSRSFDDEDALAREAQQVAQRFSAVDSAPLTLPLTALGVAGIAGPTPILNGTARALGVQLAAHHAPSEARLAVVFPEADIAEWAWVRWLPHVWDEQHARRRLGYTPDGVRRVVGEMDELIKRRALQEAPTERPTYVVVLSDPALWEETPPAWLAPILRRLRTEGPAVGVYTLFLGHRAASLPHECSASVDATGTNSILRVHRRPAGDEVFGIVLDQVGATAAEAFARACAPIQLADSSHAASGEIPRRVALFDLFGTDDPEALRSVEQWESESEPFTTLAVPIGMRAGGEPLMFDLHDVTEALPAAGGPNALIAGTVGSGKSELLLSLIASLSVHFHPHEVVFALLDFKGGATSDPVRDLPHVVSTLTDLELDQVPRALVSLKAELARREQLFREASEQLGTTVNHIDMYLRARREGRVTEPLPYLVLIVDEFVVLKQALPEQMDKFVNIAVKGRALGIRMLLAAQKPAGAIGDQIRANTRSRICLRVAQAEDSQEMIGRADAVNLTGVGRAFLRIGEDEVFEAFQSAWSGAPMRVKQSLDGQPTVVEVELDGTRHAPRQLSCARTAALVEQNQLQALIAAVRGAAEAREVPKLRGPWLPLLPESIDLASVRPTDDGGWDGARWTPSRRWLAPVIGVVDDPHCQTQEPLSLPLGVEGNLAISGAPGTGKTTLLHTLLKSLCLDHPPSEVQCYVWDSSGALRNSLEPLPHVGSVVLGSETERVERWWSMLRQQLADRTSQLASTGAQSWAELVREHPGQCPAAMVAIDNFPVLAATYEDIADAMTRFAQQCASVGMYLVVTTSAPLPYRMVSSFPLKVALELADSAEYPDIVGDTRVDADTSARLVPKRGVRGRALVAHPPREFQTALPPRIDADAMTSSAGDRVAVPVSIAPDKLPLADVLRVGETAGSSTAVPLGVQLESLDFLRVDLDEGPHFVIAGPHRSGKSTALQTWLLALSAHYSPEQVRLLLIDFGSSPGLGPLRALPHAQYFDDADRVTELVEEIDVELRQRRHARDEAHQRLVIAIDDADQFDAMAVQASSALESVLRRQRGLGCHVLLAGLTGDLASSYSGLIGTVRANQTGLIVGSGDDGGSLNLRLPRQDAERALPPARGYYVRKGYPPRAVQLAAVACGNPPLADWVGSIERHWRA